VERVEANDKDVLRSALIWSTSLLSCCSISNNDFADRVESNGGGGLSFLRAAFIWPRSLLCCCSISNGDFTERNFCLLFDDVFGQAIDDCLPGAVGLQHKLSVIGGTGFLGSSTYKERPKPNRLVPKQLL